MHALIQNIKRCLGRRHGVNYYEQLRRSRGLDLVLWFVGTVVNGAYMGLHRWQDAIDCGTKAWDRLFEKRKSKMHETIVRGWEWIRRMNWMQREKFFESTITILSAFSTPCIEPMVSPGPSLDAERAVREGWACSFDLEETDDFPPEDMDTVAGLLISMFAQTGTHGTFYFALEEVEKLIAEDIRDFLARNRSRKKPCILLAQDIDAFKGQFTDARTRGMSQPGLICTFGTKDPETLEWAAELHATPSLDITMNWKPSQYHIGWDYEQTKDITTTKGRKSGTRKTVSKNKSRASERRRSRRKFVAREKGAVYGIDAKLSETNRKSEQESTDKIESDHYNRDLLYGGTNYTATQKKAETTGRDESREKGQSRRWNVSDKEGKDWASMTGWTDQSGMAESEAIEEAEFESVSEAFRTHILPVYKTLWFPNGLKYPIDAQNWYVKKMIRGFAPREMLVSEGNKPSVKVVTHFVREPFDGKRPLWLEFQARLAVEQMAKIYPFLVPTTANEPKRLPASPKTANPSNTPSPQAFSPITELRNCVLTHLKETDESATSDHSNGPPGDKTPSVPCTDHRERDELIVRFCQYPRSIQQAVTAGILPNYRVAARRFGKLEESARIHRNGTIRRKGRGARTNVFSVKEGVPNLNHEWTISEVTLFAWERVKRGKEVDQRLKPDWELWIGDLQICGEVDLSSEGLKQVKSQFDRYREAGVYNVWLATTKERLDSFKRLATPLSIFSRLGTGVWFDCANNTLRPEELFDTRARLHT